MKLKIGIIGDYQADSDTHLAMQPALNHSGDSIGLKIESIWLPTDQLERDAGESQLSQFDGFWAATGSPCNSLQGALAAIKFAREQNVPFLGTCAGCQHAIIEITRHVLGLVDAQHAEYDPYSPNLFVSKLVCSLAGQEMNLALKSGSVASELYGRETSITERYYCNFGLARKHEALLELAGFKISGQDISEQASKNEIDSQARIFELSRHPFFLATLFVPQVRSTEENPHPVVTGFVKACSLVGNKV
jgi:CTP synthase (UTP-ammonia lyase)